MVHVARGVVQNTAGYLQLCLPVCENRPIAHVYRQTVNWTPQGTPVPCCHGERQDVLWCSHKSLRGIPAKWLQACALCKGETHGETHGETCLEQGETRSTSHVHSSRKRLLLLFFVKKKKARQFLVATGKWQDVTGKSAPSARGRSLAARGGRKRISLQLQQGSQ